MKLSEIAKQYGFDEKDFKKYLHDIKAPINSLGGLLDPSIDDKYVNKAVTLYQDNLRKVAEAEAENQRMQEAEEFERQQKQRAMSEILISSGFSFEGYSIVKYSGYISGDDSIEIPRGSYRDHGADICKAMVIIRRQALAELKEAAYNLGCNAVIGVDFDYLTLEPQTVNITGGITYEPYVICVTANGNAVVIEKK